jgi:predicted enzyme related to lactoylglutathione lyase
LQPAGKLRGGGEAAGAQVLHDLEQAAGAAHIASVPRAAPRRLAGNHPDITVSGGMRHTQIMETKMNDRRIDYIEFPAADVARTKAFYTHVFGWKFTDYGPDYTSFEDGRLSGGFAKTDGVTRGGPLVVIYAADLAAIEAAVRASGGAIVKETFSFPGGRRFHFTDPSGNELAVWSE